MPAITATMRLAAIASHFPVVIVSLLPLFPHLPLIPVCFRLVAWTSFIRSLKRLWLLNGFNIHRMLSRVSIRTCYRSRLICDQTARSARMSTAAVGGCSVAASWLEPDWLGCDDRAIAEAPFTFPAVPFRGRVCVGKLCIAWCSEECRELGFIAVGGVWRCPIGRTLEPMVDIHVGVGDFVVLVMRVSCASDDSRYVAIRADTASRKCSFVAIKVLIFRQLGRTICCCTVPLSSHTRKTELLFGMKCSLSDQSQRARGLCSGDGFAGQALPCWS